MNPRENTNADTVVVTEARLREYCEGILRSLGVPESQAETIAETMVEADLRGVDSHGSHLMSLYVKRLRAGDLRAHTKVTVVSDDGPILQLDGGLGIGQVAGVIAMDHAIEKARQFGVGAVGVRESSHLGALGYYTLRAALQGIFAIAFQNGPPFVPPFGGRTGIFSTNPISYAVPAGEEFPIVYDVATTAVAGNKILLARKRGDREIPADWARDERGRPTTDPQAASIEHLQWFGGHKGFGIGMLVEILSGVLTGSSFGRTEISDSPLTGMQRVSKGYLFLTIDVSRFMPLTEFRARTDTLIRDVHASQTAEGVERIYVPGEIEHLRRAERLREGIPLPAALARELEEFGADAGLGTLAADGPG